VGNWHWSVGVGWICGLPFLEKHMICIYNYIYTHTKRWLKLYCREIGHSWACWKIGCHQKTVENHIFSIKTAIILDIPHFRERPTQIWIQWATLRWTQQIPHRQTVCGWNPTAKGALSTLVISTTADADMLSFILVFDRILVKMCWDHDHWVGSRRCQGKLKISTCSLVGLVITWTDYEVNKTFETASARVHRLTDVSCFFLLVCTFCIIENEYIYIYIKNHVSSDIPNRAQGLSHQFLQIT